MYEIRVTDDYPKLVKFFVENQLEFDGDEEVDTDIIECYEIQEEEFIGAAVLAKREGKFICDGIAINPKYRNKGIGKLLLDRLIDETKKRNGDSIYLVARSPEFFRKYGFQEESPENAPNFFECKYCPQYRESCFPEIMKYSI